MQERRCGKGNLRGEQLAVVLNRMWHGQAWEIQQGVWQGGEGRGGVAKGWRRRSSAGAHQSCTPSRPQKSEVCWEDHHTLGFCCTLSLFFIWKLCCMDEIWFKQQKSEKKTTELQCNLCIFPCRDFVRVFFSTWGAHQMWKITNPSCAVVRVASVAFFIKSAIIWMKFGSSSIKLGKHTHTTDLQWNFCIFQHRDSTSVIIRQ